MLLNLRRISNLVMVKRYFFFLKRVLFVVLNVEKSIDRGIRIVVFFRMWFFYVYK